MTKLSKTCLILLIINIFLLVTMTNIGKINKFSNIYNINTICELPCWIGIVPGKTSTTEARNMLYNIYYNQKVVYYQEENVFAVTDLADGSGFGVSFVAQDDIVNLITIIPRTNFQKHGISVGDFLTQVHSQFQVRLATGINMNRFIFVYNFMTISLDESNFENINNDYDCYPISAKHEIGLINIYSGFLPKQEWHSNAQRWRGFQPCYSFQLKLIED